MKRILKAVSICITLMMVFTAVIGTQTGQFDAHAGTIKISKTKVTLNKGSSTTLKILGTKSKPKWASGNKRVATVNTAGKVTAKKTGNATIIARVGKTKYYCKVTVKSKPNYKKLIVGMWEGPWIANGYAHFEFMKNGTYYFSGYWENDSNSFKGTYRIKGNQLIMDLDGPFTIRSIRKGILSLKTYDGTYNLQATSV